MAFQRWQEVRSDENKRKQYSKCRKRVRRAIKEDKEKWLNEMMKEMEEDMRRHKQGSFFKKMRSLTQSRVTPTSIILDENNRPLHKAEEKLARWQRHFSEVLNVQNDLEEGVVMALEDHSQSDTLEVSREEVVRAVNKLQNGKAAGGDKVVAELVKKGGETMVNWLLELIQEVWRTRRVPQEWKDSTLVPLHKKRDRKECTNYRGISLLSVPGKVHTLVLLERLQAVIDPQLSETQYGFRKGRGTIDQIWVTRQVLEKAVEYKVPIHLCFVDLSKAYDSVNRTAMLAVLRSYGVPQQLVEIIQDLYTGTQRQVKTEDGESQVFEVKTGVRQGCVLSPLLFNCFMDRVIKDMDETLGGGLHVEYTTSGGLFLSYRDKTEASAVIQDIMYADDLALAAETRCELQHMLNVLDNACN